jgi:hypothetical protein
MFASREERTVQVKDGDDTVDVTIRKLSGRNLERARQASTIEQGPAIKSMGGEVIKALQSDALNELAKELKKDADPKARYKKYDRQTTLELAIKRWSCEKKMPLSPTSIEDLEEAVAQQVFEAVIDLSDPPPAVAEAQGKGDSEASTSS